MGTITKSDPMPQAWLSRFGRTVADQVLDSMDARIAAPRTPGSAVSFAGQQLSLGATALRTLEAQEAEAELGTFAQWLGEAHDQEAGRRPVPHALSERDLLADSSFAFTGGTPEGSTGALWGRAARPERAPLRVAALLLVYMAHIAGLVAAGVHASPVRHADIMTGTTTKTLRRPRGRFIVSRSEEFAKRWQSAVFPEVQESLYTNVLAAKAVCLGEALRPAFRYYERCLTKNARTLATSLAERGIGIIGGGTDTHLMLLDLSWLGLLASEADATLARAGVPSNKNPVAFDSRNPAKRSDLRLGVSAVTTRAFGTAEMEVLGEPTAGMEAGRQIG